MNSCVYAVLHLPAFVALWWAVYAVCAATAGLGCVLAVIAGLIVSAAFIYSFVLAVNRCRAGR